MRKTLVFCGVAILLAALAFLTAPRRVTPRAFLDQGEPFFPEFTDPNTAKTLEVIDFDEETGSAVPFKVTFQGGLWTIPSHHNFPAKAEDRVAKTAASIIEIKKDDFRTDNVSDHEACGVIDPLETESVGLKGRGKRVTIKGENDVLLADLIIGKSVEGAKESMRFVRVPGQKRVYASRMNLDVSTKFGDWIEPDLLQTGKGTINNVVLRNYSINERTGRIDERDRIVLEKNADWTMEGLGGDEEIVGTKLTDLLGMLGELKIEGVRPKSTELSQSLTRTSESLAIDRSDLISLQEKGYFFSKDGRLLSNEGEVQARTVEGIIYTLRFGEVVYGTGLALTAGTAGGAPGEEGQGENRYLFVTATFDSLLYAVPEPPPPPNTDYLSKPDSLWTPDDYDNRDIAYKHRAWVIRRNEARGRADALNADFAKWYYVISASSFEKLRPARSDLVRKK